MFISQNSFNEQVQRTSYTSSSDNGHLGGRPQSLQFEIARLLLRAQQRQQRGALRGREQPDYFRECVAIQLFQLRRVRCALRFLREGGSSFFLIFKQSLNLRQLLRSERRVAVTAAGSQNVEQINGRPIERCGPAFRYHAVEKVAPRLRGGGEPLPRFRPAEEANNERSIRPR